MEIFLFSRPGMEQTPDELRELAALLGEHFPLFRVNADFACKLASAGVDIPACRRYDKIEGDASGHVAISYGGDGTFLDCVRAVGGSGAAVLGINSGRLGFLANVPRTGIRHALADIKEGRFAIEKRTLLQAEGDFGRAPDYPYAFNEFSLQRGGAAMIAVETYVDGEMVATYWGDGVLVSTPAGSTAFSLSVGGPVLAPGCDSLVIAPIAPHNLTMRPVVIPDGSLVRFRVLSRHDKPYATLDNMTFPVEDGARFTVSKAKNCTFLVRLQNISFYDTLRNKMMWGIDRRDETK